MGEIFFVGWSLFMVVISVAFFIWGWKTGQFKDIEAPKYKILEDREPKPWHEKEGDADPGESGNRQAEYSGGNV